MSYISGHGCSMELRLAGQHSGLRCRHHRNVRESRTAPTARQPAELTGAPMALLAVLICFLPTSTSELTQALTLTLTLTLILSLKTSHPPFYLTRILTLPDWVDRARDTR